MLGMRRDGNGNIHQVDYDEACDVISRALRKNPDLRVLLTRHVREEMQTSVGSLETQPEFADAGTISPNQERIVERLRSCHDILDIAFRVTMYT